MSSALYPITLNRMDERLALVVGGGPVGARKAQGVLAAGGKVLVVSPAVVPAIARLVEDGRVEWRERGFEADDLVGVDLVFAATDDRVVNGLVARLAGERKILCNVADMPGEGDFHSAAVLRQDGLVIGVNNLERDPRRAVAVRGMISEMLEEEELSTKDTKGAKEEGRKGKAFLVGAGPGHPGLITVRGMQRLVSAEVVLYDRLIARELLDAVGPDAELIFVGKRAGHHPKPQPEINRILLEKVRAGKRVVRLKGGDPFVFSRGGEEVLALREAGLPFEIVPGLTSAIAAPAFAGIPVTQKGVNSSFTISTGHEADGKVGSMLDWGALARQEMLMLLMSVKRLSSICGKLVDAGKNPETPAALISWATTDQQSVLTGTLSSLPQLFLESDVKTPAIIVVGEVVGLAEKMKWHQVLGEAGGFVGEELSAKGAKEEAPHPSPLPREREQEAKICLVGAGPGSADLITVRGLEKLRKADVVLYDRLVNPQLLAEVQAGAEVVNVGKSPKRDRYPQSEINRLLVDYGRTGKRVVRLKGGDPFVFGLGGDECLALREAGLAYEIVPGLSSVTAVPAHAGIPLTQRGVNTSFTVVSGHAAPSESEVWNNLPQHSTLVVLMGVGKLAQIAAHLVGIGRNPETLVAIIESGTTAQQRVTVGTLATIVALAVDVKPPALIVIGDVVRLREQMSWFDVENFDGEVWGEAVK